MRTFLPIAFFTSIFLLINILVASQISTKGGYLTDLENRTLAIAKENEVLEKGISEATSLATIAAVASNLGYTQAQVIYVTNELPVAMEKTR